MAVREDLDQEMKAVADLAVAELANIQNCLGFLVDHASRNKAMAESRIKTNGSFILSFQQNPQLKKS